MDATSYTSSYEQKLAQMQLGGQLSSLRGVAQDQKTTAELQLEVAQQMIDELGAQAESTNAFYQEQLIYAQDQINELKGLNGSVLTVAGAVDALGSAISASKMQSSNGLAEKVNALYLEILGRNADAAGLADWTTRGISIEEIRAGIIGSQEAKARGYATGGAYPGGLAMVGEQGAELINFNRPGQIYTAGQTAEILGGGSLAAEIQGLRTDIQAQSRSNAQIQIRTAKVLERWETNGLPEVRLEV
jgi:phage-related tail protein